MSHLESGPLQQLIYVSSAVGDFGTDDLDSILRASRKNNPAANVTGLLLFHDGCFFQALEGPGSEVRRIYEIVRQDPRHSGVIVLQDKPCAQRAFANWAMGYVGPKQMTGPQRDALVDLSSLRGGETRPNMTTSKPMTTQIESFLASFRDFAPI